MHSATAPLPRYENAIVVGDAAAEALAALKIYGRALVGGEIPNVETWHSTEKILACTSSGFAALSRFLAEQAREMDNAYVLLADTGVPGENPAVMRESLEIEGCSVRVLDVTGEALDVVARAGALYGRDQEAAALAQESAARMLALQKKPPLPSLRVLVLLGLKNPISGTVYCLAATACSALSRDVLSFLGCDNPIVAAPHLEAVAGMHLLTPLRLSELLLTHGPDVIALTGDSTAAWQFVQDTLRYKPSLAAGKAFRRQAVVPLPWYCDPMGWRLPQILEVWYEALTKVTA